MGQGPSDKGLWKNRGTQCHTFASAFIVEVCPQEASKAPESIEAGPAGVKHYLQLGGTEASWT